MRSATVDFNSRDSDGVVAVKTERLAGAYPGEQVNVVDPDGELVALAVVREVRARIVLLGVFPATIRDRPSTTHLASPQYAQRAAQVTSTSAGRTLRAHAGAAA